VDCGSKAVRDSLMMVYSDKAGKYGFNDDHWGETLDSLIAICPNIPEAYQEKALPYLYNGDYATAFALIDKAVEIDQKGWRAYRGYLNCIFTRNYERAMVDLRDAQLLEPRAHTMDHTYYFYYGLCYLETGQYELAEQEFLKDIVEQRRGDGRNDIHFNSLFYLGVTYFELKALDLAEKYFKDCLQLYEQFPEGNYYMGTVLRILGNPGAESYFAKAREFYNEGYRMTEPNLTYVTFPRQLSLIEIDEIQK